MSTPNPELHLAEAFVRETDCHIFLTGKAGTGKTTFMRAIQAKTGKRLVVTAPTGVAAINAGGVTLHSFFQLPFGPFVPGSEAQAAPHRMRREKMDLIRSLDLLVIDEISMVRADLLDGVDSMLRRYRRSDLPFGGVQLLMIGDLQQLSPVARTAEWQILRQHYDTPYFFSSKALERTELVPIELKHIYRQSDPQFIDLLNRVRGNRIDPPTLARLNSRHMPGFSPGEGEGRIILCTHNHSADTINEEKMKALPGRSRRFGAEVAGEFPEQAYPTAALLELKIGAQVMFVRNDMTGDRRYFNGKIGEITEMSTETIGVRCPGDADAIPVEMTTWENIEYAVDPKSSEITRKIVGTFRQYPLKPAWAITIHKSQGLTFDRAIIDAQAAFAHGQVYVALSRCRTFEGMVLSSPLGPTCVKSDPAVQRFETRIAAQHPTQATLESARKRYQQKLLLTCFDFRNLGRVLGRLAILLKVNAEVIQVSGVVPIGDTHQNTSVRICSVGEKFQRQLQGMFSESVQPKCDPAIRERVIKASAYFETQFEELLPACLENIEVETDNREIRKKINNTLKRLRVECAEKLGGVRSCRDGFDPDRYLRAVSSAAMEIQKPKPGTEAVDYAEADVGHPELFEALKQWRKRRALDEGIALYQVMHQKTLVRIAVHLPDTITALKKIKGIGKRLAARYGDELTAMVADYRRTQRIEKVTPPKPL